MTTGNVTTYYYSGDKMITEREASTLRYFHQDSLSSTSLMTDSSGGSLGTIKFAPFGSARSGAMPTDIQFTGQRLDDTGLYYSGAGFYDSNIGSFVSAHTRVRNLNNPQSLNSPAKLFSRTGKIWQPPALAPALAVPVQAPPAQAMAEQAFAEPEQSPAAQPVTPTVEEPRQALNPEPTIRSSNGYQAVKMSDAGLAGLFAGELKF